MRLRRLGAFALCVLAVGCGVESVDVAVDPGNSGLPTLPPDIPVTAESVTDDPRYDSLGATEPAAVRDARAGHRVDDWRQLAGFEGTLWTEEVRSRLKVLVDSIHVDDGTAYGLVRNEHDSPVGPVSVVHDGAQGEVLIPVVRPGEPAPFVLDLTDSSDAPDGSDWGVTGGDAVEAPSREVRLTIHWSRGIEDPRPADTYLHEDPSEGPQPFVAFGTAEAFGEVSGLRVVGAWLDDGGAVIRVAEGKVSETHLAAGESADFVVVVHGPPALDNARLMLWATGS